MAYEHRTGKQLRQEFVVRNIILTAFVLLTVIFSGCGKNSTPAPLPHPNGTPVVVDGDVIKSITIPDDFPLGLYIRINTTEDGTSQHGPVGINRLLMATQSAPPDNDGGFIGADEDVESVAFLAREKIDGVYLGDTYIKSDDQGDTTTTVTHAHWLILEQDDADHPERWVCITRIPEWGDVIVYIASPQVSLKHVKSLLDLVVLEQESALPH